MKKWFGEKRGWLTFVGDGSGHEARTYEGVEDALQTIERGWSRCLALWMHWCGSELLHLC